MRFVRDRHALLTVLTLIAHLGAIGLAVSAVCGGSHHEGASTEECHMPAELEAACPMHKGASSLEHSGAADAGDAADAGALLQCNCGASSSVDALIGAPGLVVRTQSIPSPLMLLDVVAPFEPTAFHTPSQVVSPPPRG